MRPNELIAFKWVNVDFQVRKISVREGRVQGQEEPPRTHSSYRDIDMLPPVYETLKKQQEATYLRDHMSFWDKMGEFWTSTTYETDTGIQR